MRTSFHPSGDREPSPTFGTCYQLRSVPVPAWMEVLINLIGYAGFVVLAIHHKPPGDDNETAHRPR